MLLLACSWRIAILDCYCSYCYSCCCYLVFNIFFTLVFFWLRRNCMASPPQFQSKLENSESMTRLILSLHLYLLFLYLDYYCYYFYYQLRTWPAFCFPCFCFLFIISVFVFCFCFFTRHTCCAAFVVFAHLTNSFPCGARGLSIEFEMKYATNDQPKQLNILTTKCEYPTADNNK